MELHKEVNIDDLLEILPPILKEDVELLEKCYAEGDIFNPVFDYFEPDVKKEICRGRLTDAQAKRLLYRYDLL